MDTRDVYKLIRELSDEQENTTINLYDSVDIELNEDFVIETGVVGFNEDGIILHLDEDALEFLDFNGVLLESEDISETYTSKESPVVGAVLNRITRQHLDVLSKYGPAAVMQAVEDMAHRVGEVDEIGSSDVSIWTRQVIDDLEKGYYDNLKEGIESNEVKEFIQTVVDDDDPFGLVYEALKGTYGEDIRKYFQTEYDNIVIDSHGMLHPDDDFEKIIQEIINIMDEDFGDTNGPDAWGKDEDEPGSHRMDELAIIKKYALGENTETTEAKYQGREVPLGKPMAGDVKKSKVYVRKPNGKVVKVNFGDKNMRIKKSNPKRRKSFRARHHCENPGPRWKARYWSCRAW